MPLACVAPPGVIEITGLRPFLFGGMLEGAVQQWRQIPWLTAVLEGKIYANIDGQLKWGTPKLAKWGVRLRCTYANTGHPQNTRQEPPSKGR